MTPTPRPRPPRWADRLLECFCAPHLLEEIQGDLQERFERNARLVGNSFARRQYAWEVFTFLRPFALKRQKEDQLTTYIINPDMVRNYFTIAFRNLLRHRTYSLLNILGLAAGLACGILIYLTTQFHLSFDTYHTRADRIYRVVSQTKNEEIRVSRGTPKPLGEILRRDYPFLEQVARLVRLNNRIISIPNSSGGFLNKFEETRTFCFAEPQLFSVFDYEWLIGNPQSTLTTPNSVVLTEKYARKYFGTTNPIGQTLRFDNQLDLTVMGILKDHPANTNLTYEAYISYSTLTALADAKETLQAWKDINSEAMCYVVLPPNTSTERLAGAFLAIQKKYYSPEDQKVYSFSLQALDDTHFNTQYGGRMNKTILFSMTLVGLFLVISACINFINVATAHALKRSREVGVRKAIGSTRWQLFIQFITETALITLVAVAVALVLAKLALPAMNDVMSVFNATMSLMTLLEPKPLMTMVLMVMLVTLLAGSYPSLMLSGFNPIAALQGRLTKQAVGGFSVRRGLVIVQFFITQLFTIGVIVVMTQLQHVRRADLGFAKDDIMLISLPTNEPNWRDPIRQETLRQRLLQLEGIEQVALGNQPPASGTINQLPFSYGTRTKPESFDTQLKIGDQHYLPLFGIKLLAGRNFRSIDSTVQEVIVNETMVKQLGERSPDNVLGKRFRIGDNDNIIVGVMKDFYTNSLRTNVKPVVLINKAASNSMLALKVRTDNVPATLKAVESLYNEQFPNYVFNHRFVDDILNEFYRGDQIMLALTKVFSLIAILIGCLGMYGLVSFMVETKSKEIGIRKVLGASAVEVLWLFGREFGRLVVLGFLVAAPLGWWLMNAWLQGYTYHIQIQGWMFLLTIGIASVITVTTVSFQSLKAAYMNPVKSLKTE